MDFSQLPEILTVWIVPVIFAICFHEAAHAYVAWKLGDDTAKRLGRVTINPIKHADPFGTVILPAMLFFAGSPFLFGFAKPVPVNFHRLRHPRRDMIWVALAGPGINIVLALFCAFLLQVLDISQFSNPDLWEKALYNGIVINVVLAVFNMFPLPPLDGGRVLTGILPLKLAIPYARLERFGLLILIALLFLLPYLGQKIGMNLDWFGPYMESGVNFVLNIILSIAELWK